MTASDPPMAPGQPSSSLRGSLEMFPLYLVLELLRDAGTTGRLELTAPTGQLAALIEVTKGVPTAVAHGALRGSAALAGVVSADRGLFELVPGTPGKPNLFAGEDVLARARGAHSERAAASAPRPAQETQPSPAAPGPNTMRLRSVAGLLKPLVPDETTTVVRASEPQDVSLGPAVPRLAPTPDPLWSATHLASLVNALLYGYVGTDEDERTKELASGIASASMNVTAAGAPPLHARGSLDVAAIERAGSGAAWLVPVFHEMIRRLFEADDAVQEGNHARRVLLAAVERTLGADAALARDALRVVGIGPRLRARLSIERGSDEGPFELDEREHKIGRSAANDVRIDHGSVSRRHARIIPRSGRFVITDVGSTAGTRVEGDPLTGERVLRGGESIALGDVLVRFDYVEA